MLPLSKSASFPDVAVGDTLQYTSVVTNNGIVAITNVVLSDPIPAGSTLVPGSVVVAGTARPAADPASGISVGTIAPGASVTVTFQVSVTSVPGSGQLANQSSVSYSSGGIQCPYAVQYHPDSCISAGNRHRQKAQAPAVPRLEGMFNTRYRSRTPAISLQR
ncbi:DUF11 domain-containing protein [Paenibacillus rhizoplanae]